MHTSGSAVVMREQSLLRQLIVDGVIWALANLDINGARRALVRRPAAGAAARQPPRSRAGPSERLCDCRASELLRLPIRWRAPQRRGSAVECDGDRRQAAAAARAG